MKRVVKYRRVSTKEQSLKGFSLGAQEETLDAHIKAHGLHCVGDYIDDGYSASSSRRPGLQALLKDVEAGEIDLIIFTKLDRWFRSVAQYYKIQEILERHGVAWRAILEDYNTETSDGKFKVNIMLSVAQQEIDRTSERIKVVFEHKLSNKQAITGAQPFGYKVKNNKVVKDEETAQIVEDIFLTFEQTQSYRKTMQIINGKYNTNLLYNHFQKILTNEKYTGAFRGIPDYYPPYLSKVKFDEIQTLKTRYIKSNPNSWEYIFSRLLVCSYCGQSLAGNHSKIKNRHYQYYRCNNAIKNAQCERKRAVNESKLEKNLLARIVPELESYIFKAEQRAENQPAVSPAEIEEEINRLNYMFRKGRIQEEEYELEYEKLSLQLKAIQKTSPLTNHKQILETDFLSLYGELTPEEKRLIWRGIIEKIIVKTDSDFEIIFL